MFYTNKIYKETDCSEIFFYTQKLFSHMQNQGEKVRKRQDDSSTVALVFLVYANHRRPESRVQTSHLVEEEKEIALGRGCVPWANKSVRVHGRPSVYKAGVVHRVNNGRREKKTRAFSRQTRAVLKARDRDLRAPISLRSLREQKSQARGAVSKRKIASTRAR